MYFELWEDESTIYLQLGQILITNPDPTTLDPLLTAIINHPEVTNLGALRVPLTQDLLLLYFNLLNVHLEQYKTQTTGLS